MSIIQGLKKNVVKATVDGMEFVRVTNLSANDELINVIMYTKVNNKYKVVLPNELPYQVVNKLAIDNTYSKMNEEEIIAFLDALKDVKDNIKSNNEFLPLEYLAVDNVVDVNYILTKEAGINYYAISSLRVNEFGIIQGNTSVTPLELPYVLINIIDENKDFENKTFLVHQNTFAHVYKENNKYLTAIFEFKPNEKEEDEHPSVQLRGMFSLINIEGKYTVVFDAESKLFVEVTNEKFQKVLDGLLINIGLEKVTE